MELEELRRHWEQFGIDDPLWAILTEPDKRFGGWDIAEFLDTGRAEVDEVLALAGKVAAESGGQQAFGRALDFGCGVGRLTQALCGRFDRADGVDIAASMVEGARALNQFGERCTYHVNTTSDLRLFDDATFDFVYTARVLQHMQPRYALGYLAEFVRVLRPGGWLMFQIPTEQVVGATGPLPDDAFRATVRLVNPPGTMDAGETALVRASVRNDSPHPWPAVGRGGWYLVTAGNHWHGRDDRRAVVDDGRAKLPHDLAPGGSLEVDIPVTAPAEPGRYRLSVDLCQEGVSWFGDRGTTVTNATVKVRRRRKAAPATEPEAAATPARMEIYGVPEGDVVERLTGAGARVARVIGEDVPASSGADWQSRLFVVTRERRSS